MCQFPIRFGIVLALPAIFCIGQALVGIRRVTIERIKFAVGLADLSYPLISVARPIANPPRSSN